MILRRPEDWSDENVKRYWEYFARTAHLREIYFSRTFASALCNLLRLAGVSGGKLLDYGCGGGDLVRYLMTQGFQCAGVDSSDESVRQVNEALSPEANWLGAEAVQQGRTSLADEAFDAVTCIEVLEHVREERRGEVLGEVRRLLRPGGTLLVSTPHNEDIASDMAYCPFCDSYYNALQHIHSFNDEKLRSLLRDHGYEVLFCEAISLKGYDPETQCPTLKLRIRRWYARMLDRIRKPPFPDNYSFNNHRAPGDQLVAVAVRPSRTTA